MNRQSMQKFSQSMNDIPHSICGYCKESTDFIINTKQVKPIYIISLVCIKCRQEQKVKVGLENDTDVAIQVMGNVVLKTEEVFFDEPSFYDEIDVQYDNVMDVDNKYDLTDAKTGNFIKVEIMDDGPSTKEDVWADNTDSRQRFICDYCDKIFYTRREIIKHFRLHMEVMKLSAPIKNVKTRKCRMCEKRFYTLDDLKVHEDKHHRIDSGLYKCSLCDLTHKNPLSIRRHINTEHTDFKCTECSVNFKTYRQYNWHNQYHHRPDLPRTPSRKRDNNLDCRFCNKKLMTFRKRTVHEDEHRNAETGMFNCTICEFTHKKAFIMSNHFKNHEGIVDHICEICGRGYTNSKSLGQHYLIHDENRPFACTYENCKKTFKKQYLLHTHLQRHAGVRPYKCEYCPKTFKDATDRRRHRYSHGFVEPKFACDNCGKKFFEKKETRQHICRSIDKS